MQSGRHNRKEVSQVSCFIDGGSLYPFSIPNQIASPFDCPFTVGCCVKKHACVSEWALDQVLLRDAICRKLVVRRVLEVHQA